ncbi:hypothetical protein B0J14DRAFT_658704 [Halenospora varia]|nr:hypothetical protein B0J14DRAFT_658704 [Halenospora varia]
MASKNINPFAALGEMSTDMPTDMDVVENTPPPVKKSSTSVPKKLEWAMEKKKPSSELETNIFQCTNLALSPAPRRGALHTYHDATHLFILEQGTSDNRNTAVGRIFTCLADGSGGRDLITGLRSASDGIAVSADHKYVFWTNMGHPGPEGWTDSGSIQRCDIDSQNVITIIAQGTKTHTLKQLVIAEKSKKLYWCDREGMRVMRSDLDGNNVETLVRNGYVDNPEHRKNKLRWCVGIQVDEDAGYVYWTQKGPSKGGKGKILRCPISGVGSSTTNRGDTETLFERLPEPIDLSLDPQEGWIYWTDRGDIPLGNTVNRAQILQKGEKTKHKILVRKLHEGIGLELDIKNREMFITDLLGGVYRADLNGKNEKVFFPDLGTVTGIAIAHLD